MDLIRLKLIKMYEIEALDVWDRATLSGRYFTQKLTALGLCRWLLLHAKKGDESPIRVISFRSVKPEFKEVFQFD